MNVAVFQCCSKQMIQFFWNFQFSNNGREPLSHSSVDVLIAITDATVTDVHLLLARFGAGIHLHSPFHWRPTVGLYEIRRLKPLKRNGATNEQKKNLGRTFYKSPRHKKCDRFSIVECIHPKIWHFKVMSTRQSNQQHNREMTNWMELVKIEPKLHHSMLAHWISQRMEGGKEMKRGKKRKILFWFLVNLFWWAQRNWNERATAQWRLHETLGCLLWFHWPTPFPSIFECDIDAPVAIHSGAKYELVEGTPQIQVFGSDLLIAHSFRSCRC